ncbi:MAG: hypothetical protein JNK85_27540 [Verrucomicrobiales bacterium]|nr:hypothetical protein [Verrucomicrobiales bacterium]
MRTPLYCVTLALLVGVGAGLGLCQRRALVAARGDYPEPSSPTHAGPERPPVEIRTPVQAEPRPSIELLRLRAEVTQLRAELDRDPARAETHARGASEWAQVFDGVRPSRMPDFVSFSNLVARGNSDPISAFATFQYRLRNQGNEPMTPSRMKEIYDVPDDFDDPDARYSVHLGRGMGREVGYRVVEQRTLATGEVALVLDLEDPDGGSHRVEQVLVRRGEEWRVKPVHLERLPPIPEVDPEAWRE